MGIEHGDLLRLWGKARPDGIEGPRYHPLIYHLLDVAAVGEALLRCSHLLGVRLRETAGVDAAGLERLVGFLLALHDIGKLSRLFQAKVPELWPERLFGAQRPDPANAPRLHHTELGLELLLERCAPNLDAVFPNWRASERESLLTAILAHHGRPRAAPTVAMEEAWGRRGLEAAEALLALLADLFQPPSLPVLDRRSRARASWIFAGLAILADWLGSSQRSFPYVTADRCPVAYLEEVARPRAARAVAEAGLAPAPPSSCTGFRALVGGAVAPSPVQSVVERLELPLGPLLVLIEDLTGGGKTEAALLSAQRLLAAGRARGVYLGLPTMATANAMFDRLASLGPKLFDDSARPSLVLAHARADLQERFRRLGLDVGRIEDAGERGGDESGSEAAAWLGDDRRKAFLADLGVGTIDQALLAALPASFQALRAFGLAERVLVVDEAHAYDAYTTRLLVGLLGLHAALGGVAIVLSATLPLATRRELVKGFAKGLARGARDEPPEPRESAYPLVTVFGRECFQELPAAHRPDLARTVSVERTTSEDEAIEEIQKLARAGAAVVWIRNTVDDAIEGRGRLASQGLDPELFHARFAMGDRIARERSVLARFGKQADPDTRRGVLVATQVVEQSLDLDFDLVVSDLAPIDALLQRAGRLWRHPGRTRPIEGPRLVVISPDPVDDPTEDWIRAALPGTAAVYRDHARLWLTARALFARERLRVPEDVRELVEAVYASEAPVPTRLQRSWFASLGERSAAKSLADQALLDPERGYVADQVWNSDARTPTRLGEPMVTLRLARFSRGRLEPWCDDVDPRRAWALSEVQVRANRLATVELPPDCTRKMVDRVRRSWGRFEAPDLFGGPARADLQLLPLIAQPDGTWHGRGRGPGDGETELRYSSDIGLVLSRTDAP
jgi:CRISPR-associated endonuclease/helicase Cas3